VARRFLENLCTPAVGDFLLPDKVLKYPEKGVPGKDGEKK